MLLTQGMRVGTYDVVALLGKGGMGEVYRARDARLHRDVAVKVLPEAFALDPDRLARFEREAQVLASLNHPNIAAIYGVEGTAGITALVLELVEGTTLADRIAQGPIAIEAALPMAQQIADALEAAHEHGVVHRDLKPANIKVSDDGRVKVLDFGLAKVLEPPRPAADIAQSPTVTSPAAATLQGVILGTVAYMAPEQAVGKPVDKRVDIWAFGCVLYEMLTGRSAFSGDDVSDTLASVLRSEPDWTALPASTSSSIRTLLRRCLEKDRRERLPDIGAARLEIRDALARPRIEPFARAVPAPPRRAGAALPIAFLVGVVVASAFWLATRFGERDVPPVARLVMSMRPAEQLGGRTPEGRPTRTEIALSPDGRLLVFSAFRAGQRQLYCRQLSEMAAIAIPGTDGGSGPFFSPDGQSLGYWTNGELRKVSLAGGVPVTLAQVSAGLGRASSWGADGRIVFAGDTGGLWQVSGDGGMPEPLTSLDSGRGEVSHRLPHVLPDGDAVVFTVARNRFPRWDETQIFVHSRRTGKRTLLIEGGADARYIATGHLVYVREGTLMAAPFDLTRLQVTGGSVGVLADLMQAAYMQSSADNTGAAQFTVSRTGTLAYVPGGVLPEAQNRLVWVDRAGRVEPLPTSTGPFEQPRLSPDGTRFAVHTWGRQNDIQVRDIARNTAFRLTSEGRNASPVWTPDGARIVYRSAVQGVDGLFWRPADGSGVAEPMTTSDRNLVPGAWSPDAKVLLFYEVGHPNTGIDMWVLPMDGDRKARSLLASRFAETGADFSPDGQWLAYSSNESGHWDVHVRSYPSLRTKQIIARGMSPIWRRDGKELFYLVPEAGAAVRTSVMAVPVRTQPALSFGTPRRLFGGRYGRVFPARSYDVTADGMKFLMAEFNEAPAVPVTDIVLVLNWFEELKGRGVN
jgi:eukaryotic-like serine/threonine-protein kinase